MRIPGLSDTSLKARSIRTWPSVRAIDHRSQGRLLATIASARSGIIARSAFIAFGPTLRPVPASMCSSALTRSRQARSISPRCVRPEVIRLPAIPAPQTTMRGRTFGLIRRRLSQPMNGSCGAFRDDRDHAAAVGPLVLGAAGDEDRGVVDDAGGDRADRRADMPLLVDVAIIEHHMRFAADHAVAGGFAFHKDGSDPRRLFAGKLQDVGKAEARERAANSHRIERILHGSVLDRERAGPLRTHADDDDLVGAHFDARGTAGHRRESLEIL